MQSRLETLNPELAEHLKASDFTEAKGKVLSMLLDRLEKLPDKIAKLFPEDFDIQSHSVSQHQIDAFEDRYFAAEEMGNDEDASASFMVARLLSAVQTWQAADCHFQLCEAAYEVQFANGQPL